MRIFRSAEKRIYRFESVDTEEDSGKQREGEVDVEEVAFGGGAEVAQISWMRSRGGDRNRCSRLHRSCGGDQDQNCDCTYLVEEIETERVDPWRRIWS